MLVFPTPDIPVTRTPRYVGQWTLAPHAAGDSTATAVDSLASRGQLLLQVDHGELILVGRALVADSKETWVCSYLSLALLIGLGLYAAAGWWWADPIAALAMLPVIVWQGWETLTEARGHDDADHA
jgi:hypothetical protein